MTEKILPLACSVTSVTFKWDCVAYYERSCRMPFLVRKIGPLAWHIAERGPKCPIKQNVGIKISERG